MPKVSIRVRETDLEQIDHRRAAAGLTRTAYMLRAALDVATADEQRFEEIEQRLERAEAALFER